MKQLTEICRPGLMLSQVWPRSREKEGETARVLGTALSKEQFAAFQSVEIPYARERDVVRGMLSGGRYRYTYCLTRILNDQQLNLSSLDERQRRRSCDVVVEGLDQARDAGADSVSLVSGQRPESDTDRYLALSALAESMRSVIPAAMEPPALSVVLEPLDVTSHKKMTLGYTIEAIALCEQLALDGLSLRLTLDSAHIILNGETPEAALQSALNHVDDFHYCNCVTDRSHPLYGDNHIRFGPPGVVGIEAIAAMMRVQVLTGFFDPERRPAIMCEVLNDGSETPDHLMDYCMDSMQAAWVRASSGSTSEVTQL